MADLLVLSAEAVHLRQPVTALQASPPAEEQLSRQEAEATQQLAEQVAPPDEEVAMRVRGVGVNFRKVLVHLGRHRG